MLYPLAKPSANSIALAKFIKEKIVLQKEKLKKGLELDAEKYSPKRRLERLMTKGLSHFLTFLIFF